MVRDVLRVVVEADGAGDPLVESVDAGVHAGDVSPAAADAEADHSDLVPMLVLLAHQRPPAVTLERETGI